MHKKQMNWDMDRAIQQGTLMLAGVRSDGGHGMQEHPSSAHSDGQFVMVWPTSVFPREPGYSGVPCAITGAQSYWSYCQGLALMDGASPWVASPDALEIYGPSETIVEVPSTIPSTVHIEELDSDLDDDWVNL